MSERALELQREEPSDVENSASDSLYGGIVPVRQIPTPTEVSQRDRVEINIVDDYTVGIGTRLKILSSHELFLFNALMLTRDQPRTAAELKAMGFRDPGFGEKVARHMFQTAFKQLAKEVNIPSLPPVVLVTDAESWTKSRYHVNPNLVVRDMRDPSAEFEQPGVIRKLVFAPMKNAYVDDEEWQAGYDIEGETKERDQAFFAVLRKYKNHPFVEGALMDLKNDKSVTKDPVEAFARYLQEIGQYDLLQWWQERELCEIMEKGLDTFFRAGGHLDDLSPEDEQSLIDSVIAHQTMYVSNLRLVVGIAKKYAGYNFMSIMDLVQEGNIGLGKAVRRFDHEKGFKFSTYATWWVRQEMTKSIADKARTVRIPVHVHEQWIKLRMQIARLDTKLGREPTLEEIAAQSRKSIEEVTNLLRVGQIDIVSLDTPPLGSDSEASNLGETIQDPRNEIEERIEEISDKDFIDEVFSNPTLTFKEKYILATRLGIELESLKGHGFVDSDGRTIRYDDLLAAMAEVDKPTLDAVGNFFDVTWERIRQIESRAKKKIRSAHIAKKVSEFESDNSPSPKVGKAILAAEIAQPILVPPEVVEKASQATDKVLEATNKRVVPVAMLVDMSFDGRPTQQSYEYFKEALRQDPRLEYLGSGDFRIVDGQGNEPYWPGENPDVDKERVDDLVDIVLFDMRGSGLKSFQEWQIIELARAKGEYLTKDEANEFFAGLLAHPEIRPTEWGGYAIVKDQPESDRVVSQSDNKPLSTGELDKTLNVIHQSPEQKSAREQAKRTANPRRRGTKKRSKIRGKGHNKK